MTATTHRLSPGGFRAEPPDAVLLRIVADDRHWVAALPPAPLDGEVTVSLSPPRALERHRARLSELGYVVVGATPVAQSSGSARRRSATVVDFLVRRALRDAHPGWWRLLAGQADQVFSLALGPVLVACADLLRLHLRPRP